MYTCRTKNMHPRDMNAQQANVESLLSEHHKEILAFANASGALATTGKGALSSLPAKEQVLQLIK